MKLKIARTEGRNSITSYGDEHVGVNGVRYPANLIVLPDRLIENWTAASAESLGVEDFARLAEIDAEIILLGTGNRIRFPHPAITHPLIAARKGLEVMDLHAACRTYNVLANEGRKVAAALLPA